MSTIEIGNKGELLAYKYLKKQKYKILEKNYRTSFGEIDIIARTKNCIVFVEVKAKSNLNFCLPREMVDARKQHKIEQVAQYFIKQKDLSSMLVRFDVIEIIDDKINHIENAW